MSPDIGDGRQVRRELDVEATEEGARAVEEGGQAVSATGEEVVPDDAVAAGPAEGAPVDAPWPRCEDTGKRLGDAPVVVLMD